MGDMQEGKDEMEDMVDTVARLIKYFGEESLLEERAAKLLALANDIKLAAGELGVPHDELALAAAALQNADAGARRLGAVDQLGGAAAALPLERLGAVRGAARRLELACREHRQAAGAVQAVLRAADERAAWREGRLADWLRLRFWGCMRSFGFFRR